MNKAVIAFLLILVLGHLSSLILPWWIIAVITFLVVLLFNFKESSGFFIGFFGVFLLWLVYSIWLNVQNSFILNTQIGQLFGGLNGKILIIISAVIAGMVGGLGGWLGSQVNGFFKNRIRVKTD